MDYSTVLSKIKANKGSHGHSEMEVIEHSHFSILRSDKCEIIVDADIAKDVRNRMWCLDGGGYAVANVGHTLIRLHDYVMAKTCGKKPEGCYVDHINHDKLDNRRQNLRFVTPAESVLNIPLKANNTSGITGVSHGKNGKGYRAYITIDKKRIELGTYPTIEQASAARRVAEDRYGFKTRPGSKIAL